MMRLTFGCWVLVACLALSVNGFASAAPRQSVDDATRVERLVALSRLWGRVKYFHPALAYRTDVDWDAALVAAIPKVREAGAPAEYAAAVERMLAVLGDPLTRVVERQSATRGRDASEDRGLDYQLTAEGVLVVRAGNYFALQSPESQAKLKGALAELPKARAIVLDLRAAEPAGAYGDLQLVATLRPLERLITTTELATPGERRRVHRGFANDSVFTSGQYSSGLLTADGARIAPAKGARDVPSVTIVNEHSALLASTLPLQAAGRGLVVFEGDPRTGAIGTMTAVDLGEGRVAEVRAAEPIYEDGTSGDLYPDVVVGAPHAGADEAMATALARARDFRPSTVVRKRLAGSGAPAWDRSYPEMTYPALEYRLLAAFRIWNAVEHFYPYKHLMGEDWDAVLREVVPKFERAKDALEYSLAVAEMATRIHDSHAYVSGAVIDEHLGTGYPPIRARIVEGLPVITSLVDAPAAAAAGVAIGDVVVRVDGEDAAVRLARYAKYIAASTPQSNLDKAALQFMNGAPGSVVTLVLRDRNGKEKQVRLNRKHEDFSTLYHRERSGEVLELLPGNIGYADLDRLTVEMVDEMFERFKDTKAIVFDMRGYPKYTVWAIVPRLTDREVAGALIETPLVGYGPQAGSSDTVLQTIAGAAPGARIYKGRTVMLVDERTVSQAEHTGLFLKAANGTAWIGSRTAGANGEITRLSVPGGMAVGFTGQAVRFTDGRQLQRVGLVPDVEVAPTLRGIQEGRDEVLDRALEYLGRERN